MTKGVIASMPNSFIEFIKDLSESDIYDHNTDELYNEYLSFMEGSNLKAMAKNAFVKRINVKFNSMVIRVMCERKTYKVFVPYEKYD